MYKLEYVGRFINGLAFVYNINNYYVYVAVDRDYDITGPSFPVDNIELIKSRFNLENPEKFSRDENYEKMKITSNCAIEFKINEINEIINFDSKEKMAKVGLN